jgi:L-ascorbate metabolism protein UlaG (beta-lactamase superfamily)
VTRLEVAWLGHATVDIRIGGARFVTDPLLRDRVGHLRRHAGTSSLPDGMPVTAVLVSHLHHDHLDLPSLRRLPVGTPLVVPRGAARLVRGTAPGSVVEASPGDELDFAGIRVTAVPADHQSNRTLSRVRAAPLGYILEGGGRTVYFPGDTDLHPVMRDLPSPDVALLPIWGWGPSIGPGHLDPARAVEAAAWLRARAVLPVHWGTLAPIHTTAIRDGANAAVRRTRLARTDRAAPAWLSRPGSVFQAAVAERAPELELRLVAPGPTAHRF